MPKDSAFLSRINIIVKHQQLRLQITHWWTRFSRLLSC